MLCSDSLFRLLVSIHSPFFFSAPRYPTTPAKHWSFSQTVLLVLPCCCGCVCVHVCVCMCMCMCVLVRACSYRIVLAIVVVAVVVAVVVGKQDVKKVWCGCSDTFRWTTLAAPDQLPNWVTGWLPNRRHWSPSWNIYKNLKKWEKFYDILCYKNEPNNCEEHCEIYCIW